MHESLFLAMPLEFELEAPGDVPMQNPKAPCLKPYFWPCRRFEFDPGTPGGDSVLRYSSEMKLEFEVVLAHMHLGIFLVRLASQNQSCIDDAFSISAYGSGIPPQFLIENARGLETRPDVRVCSGCGKDGEITLS